MTFFINENFRMCALLSIFVATSLLFFGCHKIYSLDPADSGIGSGNGYDGSNSAGTDADADADGDGDADSDTDTDTDADTDADVDSEESTDTEAFKCCEEGADRSSIWCDGASHPNRNGTDCLTISRRGRGDIDFPDSMEFILLRESFNTSGSKNNYEAVCNNGPLTTGEDIWMGFFLFEGEKLTIQPELSYFNRGDTLYLFLVKTPKCDFCDELEIIQCESLHPTDQPTIEYVAAEAGWYGVILDAEGTTYARGELSLQLDDCDIPENCSCWRQSSEPTFLNYTPRPKTEYDEPFLQNVCAAQCGYYMKDGATACAPGYETLTAGDCCVPISP